jgi:hypothetical protein
MYSVVGEVTLHKTYEYSLLYRIMLDFRVILYIYLWLYSPLLSLGLFFGFLIFYTVGRNPLTGNQPVARTLPAYRTEQI